jgi:prepilin-type N-terminal cleavage/methylation domain-containing protein
MKSDDGFTLLESLAGLTIVSCLLLLLMQSLGISIIQLKRADSAILAASLSRSVFDEIGILYPLKQSTLVKRVNNIGEWRATLAKRPNILGLIRPNNFQNDTYDIHLEIKIKKTRYEFHSVKSTSENRTQ